MRNYNEEIRAALHGEAPRLVPFTIYHGMLVRGAFEREMRERGLALLQRMGTCSAHSPDVKVTSVTETVDGKERHRTIYETPVGSVSDAWQRGGYGSARTVEHQIKTVEDYRVAEFMVRNTVYAPNYDAFLQARDRLGADGYLMAHSCYSPLLAIQVGLLGVERFCLELIDHEAEVLSLYEALCEKQREMYRIIANGPAEACLYGGNIMQETLGPERIERFILPCWQEFGDLMHEEGKMLGVHLDANNKLLLDIVARSSLDFIEAFTPPPDCDTSVAEARAAWPGKVLSLNFPSSVHLRDAEAIRKVAAQIIEEAGDRRGFILGITEDVPPDALLRSAPAILDVIESCPLD